MELADYRRVIVQGLGTLILAVIVMLIVRYFYSENLEWQIGKGALFLFAVVNPMSGMFKNDLKSYFIWSGLFMIGLSIDMAIVSTIISRESFRDILFNSKLFLLPIILFFLMMLVCKSIRLITQKPK